LAVEAIINQKRRAAFFLFIVARLDYFGRRFTLLLQPRKETRVMVGTLINVASVVTGSAVGCAIGARLPESMQVTVVQGLGLVTTLIGIQAALETQNVLILLASILTGAVLGEALCLQGGLEALGNRFQAVFSKGAGTSPAEGFITASLVFCVGPMAILGSIQDGLKGDFKLLAIKSMLDGFASIAFSASLGWGVIFSAVSVLVYQGAITMAAGALHEVLSEGMVTEMSAAGGLIIVAIGLKLLRVKDIRIANFLPALVIAPLVVAFLPTLKTWWAVIWG
jgi:hypothetical protein